MRRRRRRHGSQEPAGRKAKAGGGSCGGRQGHTVGLRGREQFTIGGKGEEERGLPAGPAVNPAGRPVALGLAGVGRGVGGG